jgi:glycolate oxidase iron-sulfur subunit
MNVESAPRSYVDLISDCVHCGFCLQACPTYQSWNNEADSPRGRIDLMKAVAEGALPLNDAVVEHFDRCLGCMGCLSACPSGVRYDLLIESTRATIERSYRRSPVERAMRAAVFALFPYRERLKLLAPLMNLVAKSGLGRAIPGAGLLMEIDLGAARAPLPELTKAEGRARARVGVIAGCVQSVFFAAINQATIRVLAAEGCDVIVPPLQGCCGALSLHTGREEEARRFARDMIAAFEPLSLDAVIINSAGCGSGLKQYGELLADDPQWAVRARGFAAKVRDVSEFLAELGTQAPRHPIEARVAYHDACHLAHAQRIRSQPRALLREIPGLELVEIPSGEQCCGSAGVYNIFEPESARDVGLRKVENILSVLDPGSGGAQMVATGNPGCMLQIGSLLKERGATIKIVHPVELLDASIHPEAPGRSV